MNMCLTVSSEEEGSCGIDVVEGGIPHGGASPPGGGADDGGQYTSPKGGGSTGTLAWMPDWRWWQPLST
jgi:hypothetical protein